MTDPTEIEAWLALHPRTAAVMLMWDTRFGRFEAYPVVGGVLLEKAGHGVTLEDALIALAPHLPSSEAMP